LGSSSFEASSHKTRQSSDLFVSFIVPPQMDGKPRARYWKARLVPSTCLGARFRSHLQAIATKEFRISL
jgi:hypothetical protein